MTNETTEKLFRSMFKDRKDIWIRKLRVDNNSTPFDYLILTNKYNYAVEIKEWKVGKYFYPNQRIEPHQIAGLRNFDVIGNNFKSFVLINCKKNNIIFCIPISVFIEHLSIKKFDINQMYGFFSKYIITFNKIGLNKLFLS